MDQMLVWAMIQREFTSMRARSPERHRRMAEHHASGGFFRAMLNWLEN
jgi:hypothetical protein